MCSDPGEGEELICLLLARSLDTKQRGKSLNPLCSRTSHDGTVPAEAAPGECRRRKTDPMPDVIVVGAGHNGLVAANLLADNGLSVLVLERSPEAGGAVRSGELTVAGFQHDLFSAFYPLAVASPVISSLQLEEHGLVWRRAPLVFGHALRGGRSVVVSQDLATTMNSLDADHSGDGLAWQEMIERWRAVAPQVLDALLGPFPPLGPGLSLLAKLKPAGLLSLVRDLLLPVRRMGEEWFGGEGAALLLAGCALHADPPPDAAGSGAFGWLLCCLAQEFGFPVPEGGAGALTQALTARLSSRGGEVQCDREVGEVIVRSGRAVGVRTREGDEIDATTAVIAAVSAPSLYLGLLDPAQLPTGVLGDLAKFQWDAATIKVDWALSSPTPWQGEELFEAGTIHIADGLDELTDYAGDLSTSRLPRRPFLIFGQQSRADPSRAPEGAATAWAYTHVPRQIRSDGAGELDVVDDKWVDGFVARMEGRVEEHAPGFRDRIIGRHVFSPAGLEAENASLAGGALFGGTAQLHQQLFFRPIPGWGRPETPIPGLYLASASAHPGGGVHGAPGANAARAAMRGAPRLRSAVLGRGGRRALYPRPAAR